jgi:hypothetical protein
VSSLRQPLRSSVGVHRNAYGESEVERLRRENEELKQKLEGSSDENMFTKMVKGVKSLLGLGRSEIQKSTEQKVQQTQDSAAKSSLSWPFGGASTSLGALGLFGALLKPVLGIMGNLLQSSQNDIDAVLTEAQSALLRSGQLGSRVECGPIYSQSYSSMNINGQQSAQVQLQFQAKGDKRSGMATCSASISPEGVQIRDLKLDGSYIDASAGPRSGVIDV